MVIDQRVGATATDKRHQDYPIVAPSFTPVIEALGDFTSVTGEAPLSLSGWELEGSQIHPPHSLVAELEKIPARIHRYVYLRELREAKAAVATVLGSGGIRIAGAAPASGQVALFQNSTQALLLAFTSLQEQGIGHVVVAAPAYFAALEICRRLRLTVSLVPAADFLTGTLDVEAICREAHSQRCAVLVTNPAYSVGIEYSWKTLCALFDALSPDTPVVLDETRLGLHWRMEQPWYTADYPPNAVVIRSPSKIFFLNGLKTSIALGDFATIQRIESLGETMLGSAPGNMEEVALAYMTCWQNWISELQTGRVGPLRRWRRAVIARLRRSAHALQEPLDERGFRLAPIDSGPYALAAVQQTIGTTLDCAHLARYQGVLLMDSAYFLHPSPDWLGFRINLCGNAEQLREAIVRAIPLRKQQARSGGGH